MSFGRNWAGATIQCGTMFVTRHKIARLTMNNERSTSESRALSILLLGAAAVVTIAWTGALIYLAHAALQHATFLTSPIPIAAMQ